ncbi:helix-turn-helix domain-containing protein [Bacillus infantis]|uniref:helix-turn-helix domain-containing protein n=1 Tax=Bacillus infantis TaxID=324767 RepID=UPI003CFAA8C9
MEHFGEYIKEKRLKAGLTISELAKGSGVSQPYISQLERGRRGKGKPSPEILKKLEDSLGVDYNELMERAGYLSKEDVEFRQSRLDDPYSKKNYEIIDRLQRVLPEFEYNHNVFIPLKIADELAKLLDDGNEEGLRSYIQKEDVRRFLFNEDEDDEGSASVMRYAKNNELEDILKKHFVSYKSVQLSEEDKKLISIFLDTLINGKES